MGIRKKCGVGLLHGTKYCSRCGTHVEKSMGDLVIAARNGNSKEFGELYKKDLSDGRDKLVNLNPQEQGENGLFPGFCNNSRSN